MIKIDDKSKCCGCSACYAVCPHSAITMKADVLGFKYPEVDMTLCVDCGLCEKVCAFKAQGSTQPLSSYAVRHRVEEELGASSSGAVFVALSDKILERGGLVYGAALDEKFRVSHIRTDDKNSRDRLRKSKYVQSDMGTIFKLLKEDLKAGKTVLFSGTPCQNAGLNEFIGEKLRANLYLVDIVCHGVPAPKIWADYLSWQEIRNRANLEGVEFRDKSFGWRSHVESFVFNGKKIYDKSYTYLFYEHLILRESCASCPFANLSRPSDITIADYWRKDKTCPDFANDKKGCSLLLVNTDKGRVLLDEIMDKLHIAEVDISECMQPNMIAPSKLHPSRAAFETDYEKYGLEYVMKRYGDLGWRYKVKKTGKDIYQFIRQTARKILRRV